MRDWLHLHRGDAPLIVALPHTGTEFADVTGFVSPWLARHDTDWFVDRLYGFAEGLGATTIRTAISRSVVDVNRDPSGASLYPGQETTELVPTTTFDGHPLYAGEPPDAREVERRRETYFQPYHDALAAEIARLKDKHERIVLFDAHSIRSRIPRLFDGTLPQFNVGTNGGETCAPALSEAVLGVIAQQPAGDGSVVLNGRFKGGWTTRHYGRPGYGVHAIQLELAIRGYSREPDVTDEANWPPAYDVDYAAPMVATLRRVLTACLDFAR